VKQFVWEPAARADLRRIDRDTARRILMAVTEFGRLGHGDAKKLTDREGLYRLRIGKWRLFFDLDTPDTIRIHGIDKRGEAY
jgi:mRNA interferase RelE/StbE